MRDKKEIILGIDPGTRITGYGVIIQEGNKLEVVDFGCIRPKEKKLSTNYKHIHEAILELCEKYRPTCIAVEMQYMQKNVQSALKLGIAKGMVILAASLREIPIFEYAPSRAKKAVTGNGQATKEQIQKMLQRLLNLTSPPKPEDASDALAMALCHIYAQKRVVSKPKEI